MQITKPVVLESFLHFVNGMIKDNSFSFPHAHWIDKREEKVNCEVLALPLNEVGGVGYHVVNTTTDQSRCGYLCLALDMFAQPGQGLEFDDFALIGEYDPDRAPAGNKHYRDRWRWGVVNYNRDRSIIRDVDWNNPHWGTTGGHGMKMLQQIGPPVYVWVKPAERAS